jgi:hypothetical protein
VCGFVFIALAIRELRKSQTLSHIKKISAIVTKSELKNTDGLIWTVEDNMPYFEEECKFTINGKDSTITRKTSMERFEDEIANFYYDTKNNKVVQKPQVNYINVISNIMFALYAFTLSYVAYCVSIGKINLVNSYLHEALFIASVASIIAFFIIVYFATCQRENEKDENKYRRRTGTISKCKSLSVKTPGKGWGTTYDKVFYSDIIEFQSGGNKRRCVTRPTYGRTYKREGKEITFYTNNETGEVSGMVKAKTSMMTGIAFLIIGILGLAMWYAIYLIK